MSSLRGERKRKFKAEINVVPYIDVMLVLLIIFMVATPMTNPSVINLPTAGQSNQPPADYIEVSIDEDGKTTVTINRRQGGNGRNVQEDKEVARDQDDLIRILKEKHDANNDLPVLVWADKKIIYDKVVQVISDAKKLGINRVGLATK